MIKKNMSSSSSSVIAPIPKTCRNEKEFLADFKEAATNYMEDNDIASQIMIEISSKLSSYGTIFRKIDSLNFAGLDFAFENHIISPINYIAKTNTFFSIAAQVLDSKWANTIIKGSTSLSKKKTLVFIKSIVDNGGGTDRCIIDIKDMEVLGRFACRLNMRKNLSNVEKTAAKLKVDPSILKTVLTKMKILYL